MDSGTLSNPEVDAFVRENFIAVKIEHEHDAATFASLDIKDFPCTIVMRSDKSEIVRLPGAYEPKEFLEKLRAAKTAQ